MPSVKKYVVRMVQNPHFSSETRRRRKRPFFAAVNLRGICALAQYMMRPIGNISASVSLLLKIRRMRFLLSNFDLESLWRYTPTRPSEKTNG